MARLITGALSRLQCRKLDKVDKERLCWIFVVLHQAAAHLPTHAVLLPCYAPAITLKVQVLCRLQARLRTSAPTPAQ